jgi:hypothetical protein
MTDIHVECEPMCTCDCIMGPRETLKDRWCGCTCCDRCDTCGLLPHGPCPETGQMAMFDKGLIAYAEAFGKAFQKVVNGR